MPPLGLGSWNTWDRMPQDERVAVVLRAVEAGAAFFDVAGGDAGRHAERPTADIAFGAALCASGVAREDIYVCARLRTGGRPRRSLRQQVKEALDRTGLDRFDAVVLAGVATGEVAGGRRGAGESHRRRTEVCVIVAEADDLVREGLAGAWGVGGWAAGATLAALDAARLDGRSPPVFAQLAYSIARRADAEGEAYRELFEARGLGLQAVNVLEGGILAGNLMPTRRIASDAGGIRGRIVRAYPDVERVARDFGATPAQLAIAFCLAYEPTVNVLVGASRLAQLESNLAAVRLARQHGTRVRAALRGFQADGPGAGRA
ncbi:aldo/keto reductase [Xylanimonas allomyrinae]|nr:aldo/keto reductase [Xylanimonas allomyrinae]